MTLEKLTKKEDMFCMAVVDGHTQYESYIIAYEPKTLKRGSIDVMASKVANKPQVKARIEELKRRKESSKIYSDVQDENYIYSLIRERLDYCKDSNNDAAISRYIDILNKMTGRYVNINKNIEDDKPLKDVSSDDLKAILSMDVEHMDTYNFDA